MSNKSVTIRIAGDVLYVRKGRKLGGEYVGADFYADFYPFRHALFKSYYVHKLTDADKRYIEAEKPLDFGLILTPISRLFDLYTVFYHDEETCKRLGIKTPYDYLREYGENTIDTRSAVKPFPHQVAAANYIAQNPQAFLYWETGTGKTLAALLGYEQLYNMGKAQSLLIVCPNTLVLNWYQKILEYFPHYAQERILYYSYDSIETRLRTIRELCNTPNAICIVNYDTFSRTKLERSKPLTPTMAIYDESQFLKNYSKRTMNVLRGVDAKRAVFLSGTPSDGKYEDYYFQFKIAKHGKPFGCSTKKEFEYTYTYRIKRKYMHTLHLTRYITNNAFTLMKEHCLSLPEKMYTVVPIVLHKEHMAFYKKIMNTLLLDSTRVQEELKRIQIHMQQTDNAELLDDLSLQERALTERQGGKFIRSYVTSMLYCRMIVSGVLYNGNNAKMEWLLEYLHPNEKYVIFAMFRYTVGRIAELLRKNGYRVAKLCGITSPEERMKIVRAFNATDELDIVIVQPAVAGYGIDLVAANTAIFYENSYSYAERKQAEDRLHRIGQSKPVQYIDLVAQGTIDEFIYRTLADKRDVHDAVSMVTTLSELETILQGGGNNGDSNTGKISRQPALSHHR